MSELREPPYEMYAKIRAEELDAKAVMIAKLQRELVEALELVRIERRRADQMTDSVAVERERAERAEADLIVLKRLFKDREHEIAALVQERESLRKRAEEEIVRRVVAEARAVAEQKRAHEDFLTQQDYIVQQQDQISQLTQERDTQAAGATALREVLDTIPALLMLSVGPPYVLTFSPAALDKLVSALSFTAGVDATALEPAERLAEG